MFLLPLFIFSIIGMSHQLCKDPVNSECGCIRRPTFTSEYLENNFPAIYALYSKYTFTAPIVTYPNCTGMNTDCPEVEGKTVQLATFTISKEDLTIGGGRNPLPSKTIAICKSDKHWWLSGDTVQSDDILINNPAACAYLPK